MAVSLTHATTAVGTDAGNGEIRKAQWNEAHTLSMATARLLGRTTTGTGAVEEISVGTSLVLSGGTLNGRVVQRVSTTSTTRTSTSTLIPADDTIPQNTEGAEAFTLAITPTKSANLLVIRAVLNLQAGNSSSLATAALFQDATVDALATAYQIVGSTSMMVPVALGYEMTAGTTSATTFKLRYGTNSGSCYINRLASSLLYASTVYSFVEITEFEV